MSLEHHQSSSVRKLAAIMFTDIVGYTSLMGEDEDKAFQLLKINRKLQRPIIEKHGGTWLKEIGDAILASFPNDSDAVYCAKEIQEACKEEPDLQLRIGIHEGEVVFEDGDVYGDGVNIASRLQSIAPAEGICISETVNRNVENKKGIETRYVKQENLKNVKRPVRIYQVDTGVDSLNNSIKFSKGKLTIIAGILLAVVLAFATVDYFLSKKSTTNIREKTIAVLPFYNLSGDPDLDYMSDGFTAEIINNLFKVRSFEKVISFSTILTYKGSDKRITQIAEELGVAYVLAGSYRRVDENVLIDTQLINGQSDDLIWLKNYDQPINRIMHIQSDIAINIGENLKAILSDEEIARIKTEPTTNTEAYHLLQRARYVAWNQYKLWEAVDFCKNAIEIDSTYADAYVFLAELYVYLGAYFFAYDPDSAFHYTTKYSEKALELDPDLSSPYWIQACAHFWYKQDFIKADQLFRKSLQLNPEDARGHGWYYEFLTVMEKPDEATDHIEKCFDLDPVNYFSYSRMAGSLVSLGKVNEAIEITEKGFQLFGNQFAEVATRIYYDIDSLDRSLEYFEIHRNWTDLFVAVPTLSAALAYDKKGDHDSAQALVDEMIIDAGESGRLRSEFHLAEYYAYSGDKELAFEYLNIAYEIESPEMIHLKESEFLKLLADDPRYWELYDQMGFNEFDEYWAGL